VTVDCEAFVNALGEGGPSRELAQHAAACARCRPVWEFDQAVRHSGVRLPAPPMAAALQRELLGHRPTTRVTSFATRTLAALAAITASVGVTLLMLPRRDLSSLTLTGIAPCSLLLLLLLGQGLFAYRGRTGLGAAPWLRWSLPVASVAVFELLAALEARGGGLPAQGDCLFVGTAIACLLAAISFRLGRRTALIAPEAAGALAGSVAGLTAILCLRVHCPSLLALHVMVVHALPLLLAIAGGAYAGRRWLSV
jgi:hypothetical protein